MMYAKSLCLLVALFVSLASCVSIGEHEQLNSEKQRVEADNSVLTQNLQQRSRDVTALEAIVDQLSQNVSRSEGMLELRGQELADAQRQTSELTASLAQVRQELSTVIGEGRTTVDRYQRRVAALTAERDSTLRTADELTVQLDQRTSTVQDLNARTRELASLRDSLMQQSALLTTAKTALEDNFAALEGKRDELRVQVEGLGRPGCAAG